MKNFTQHITSLIHFGRWNMQFVFAIAVIGLVFSCGEEDNNDPDPQLSPPEANFLFTVGSTEDDYFEVMFTDASPGVPNAWLWEFGDGNESILQNPSHSYSATEGGTYDVTLTATNDDGSNAVTKSVTITVLAMVTADFRVEVGTNEDYKDYLFINFSEGASSYLWTFGDGASSTEKSPRHSYEEGGPYIVKLVATHSNGVVTAEKEETITKVEWVGNGATTELVTSGDLGALIYDSSPNDGNVPANTIDGLATTKWASEGYTGSFITYDFGSSQDLDGISILWDRVRITYFTISVSSDPRFQTGVTQIYDAETTGSAGTSSEDFEDYRFTAVSTQYVRIDFFGNSESAWNALNLLEFSSPQ